MLIVFVRFVSSSISHLSTGLLTLWTADVLLDDVLHQRRLVDEEDGLRVADVAADVRLLAVGGQGLIVEVIAGLGAQVTHPVLDGGVAYQRPLSFVLLHLVAGVEVVLVGEEFQVEEAQVAEFAVVSPATVVVKRKMSMFGQGKTGVITLTGGERWRQKLPHSWWSSCRSTHPRTGRRDS